MKNLLLLTAAVFNFSLLFSQTRADAPVNDPNSICKSFINVERGKWFTIENKKITLPDLCSNYKRCLNIDDSDSLSLINEKKSDSIESSFGVQQFKNGLKVEDAVSIFHTQKGYVYRYKSNFVKQAFLTNSLVITDSTTVIDFCSKIFLEDTARKEIRERSAELILLPPTSAKVQGELLYAWKVIINAMLYYVDAQTGDVIKKRSLVYNCASGSGMTAHHGTQTIHTKYVGGVSGYQLFDDCNHTYHSASIHTYEDSPNPEYHDADNNWNSSGDIPGIQTHWAAHMILEYYGSYWGRNSFDGAGIAVNCYNFGVPPANPYDYEINGAGFNSTNNEMYFGVKNITNNYDNLNTIDIVGHEFTHGVTQYNGNGGLNYSGESGALNESFSDIFGVAAERWVIGTVDWTMAEDLGTPMRSLAVPNSYGNHFTSNTCTNCSSCAAVGQPDTYLGTYWYSGSACDNGGVHINSGVQNYWFYLLVNGGTGSNDIGNSYNVTSVSFADAIAIAYRTLINELNGNDSYADARIGSINAATYLFGASSQQVCSVKQAWYAVGVGANCGNSTTCSTPSGGTESATQTSATLDWNNVSSALSYTVRYRESGTSTWLYIYPTSSAGSITGLTCNTLYEWQVRADCSGSNSSGYTSSRTFTTNNCGGTSSGDNCSQAISISSYNSCSPTTSSVAGMTSSGVAIPTCSGSTSSTALDVWFVFQAQGTTHTILVDPQGTYSGTSNNNYVDPVIAVYSSCSGSVIDCEDDNGGGGGNCELTVNGLSNGTYYYIRVFDYGSSQPTYGSFDICVTHPGGGAVPSTPTNLNLTAQSCTSAVGSWNASTNNPTGYEVYLNNVYYATTANTSYVFTGLNPNTSYFLTVVGFNNIGYGNGSAQSNTETTPSCSTSCSSSPTSLQVAVTQTSASITWNTDPDASTYTVSYRVQGGAWNPDDVTSLSSYSLSNLNCNTYYEFRVKTNCWQGTISGYSSSIFTTNPCGGTSCSSSPSSLMASPAQTSASLTWNADPDASTYTVSYRVVGNSWSTDDITTSNSYNLSGLICNTQYEFRVKTNCWQGNSSGYSSRVFLTSYCSNNTCVYSPSNLQITPSTTTAILNWNTDPDASTYTINYKIVGGTWSADDNISTPSYNLSGLSCNTQYEVRVKTNCWQGNSSGYSSNIFYTLDCCPVEPQLSYPGDYSTVNGDNITFQWDAVSGATGYLFEISRDLYFNTVECCISPSFYSTGNTVNIDLNAFSQDGTCYFWRVKALGNSCNSNFSIRYRFYSEDCANSYAPVPILYYPPNGSSQCGYGDTMYYNWSASSCALNYQFQISTSSNFATSNIINDYTSSYFSVWNHASYYTQAGSIFYWRVREENNYGWSSWSNYSYFINSCFTAVNDIINENFELVLYPNPTSKTFDIRFSTKPNVSYSIRLYDIEGRIVETKSGISISNVVQEEFDVESLPQGIYIVRVQQKDKFVSRRLSKL